MKNYFSRFSSLLHVEEIQREMDMRAFDLTGELSVVVIRHSWIYASPCVCVCRCSTEGVWSVPVAGGARSGGGPALAADGGPSGCLYDRGRMGKRGCAGRKALGGVYSRGW